MFFEWDELKEAANLEKHGVDFYEAQEAFLDPRRVVERDGAHSTESEVRYFCYGWVRGRILTVRFTIRYGVIRIFGAGFWRKGAQVYEANNADRG